MRAKRNNTRCRRPTSGPVPRRHPRCRWHGVCWASWGHSAGRRISASGRQLPPRLWRLRRSEDVLPGHPSIPNRYHGQMVRLTQPAPPSVSAALHHAPILFPSPYRPLYCCAHRSVMVDMQNITGRNELIRHVISTGQSGSAGLLMMVSIKTAGPPSSLDLRQASAHASPWDLIAGVRHTAE